MKLTLAIFAIFFGTTAFAQTQGVCPNYIVDGNTGEAFCRSDIRAGESIFYWDADRNGRAEKSKHTFNFATSDGKQILFATFSSYDAMGRLTSQSWTKENLDDWQYSAKDADGDGFFESFCQYQAGGSCAPISCQISTVKNYRDQTHAFFTKATDPLLKAYAYEIYTLADKMYSYCRYIGVQRGPADERTNIRP